MTPKVSVLVLAYNLEQYIAQALDSVLMQETNFSYEIVVGEDCSTDHTRSIIQEYAQRHGHLIRPILRENNLGMNQNFAETLAACRGQFIALLDGDDYWTAPHKLQRQVDLLEATPQYSLCFHNVEVQYEDGSQPTHPFHMAEPAYYLSRSIPRPVLELEDLLPGNFMQTCSVVFRRGLFYSLPGWFYDMPTYDWPLHILNAQCGKIAYIDEIWSVYRVHPGGIWSEKMSRYDNADDVLAMINAYSLIDRHLSYRYTSELEEPTIPLYARASVILARQGNYRRSASYVRKWATFILKPRNHRARRAWLIHIVNALRHKVATLTKHAPQRDSGNHASSQPG